jgi:hydrogenase expression/formation protein HypC
MQVLEQDGTTALCERRGERRRVGLMLVGDVVPGDYVLVHVETAIKILDATDAALVDDAISCLEAANQGRDIDGFFADLTDREPELPDHLRPPEARTS